MDELTQKYLLYKNAENIQKNYFNTDKLGKIKMICSNCKKEISINGCNSHYKVCPNIYDDKFNFILNYFSGFTNSIISNNPIKLSHNIRLSKWFLVVNNISEWRTLLSFIYKYETYYKKCPVCDKGFISKKDYCSISCSLKEYHKEIKNTDKYLKRNLKISETRKKLHIIQEPWNKGLTGKTYMDHYLKEDGTNSLLEAIYNNEKWFVKTTIEDKIENLLKKLNIKYIYNYINKNQFDFKTNINNKTILIEADGDYWHKSSKRCFDINIRNMKRLEDKIKDDNIMKNKNYIVIRFWEYNINNNIDIIENFLIKLMESNDTNFENNINEIKKYYMQNS